MAALTEWLQLMLAEIARKKDDSERARAEDVQRAAEKPAAGTHHTNVTSVEEIRSARRR